jgi:hypothetical protein
MTSQKINCIMNIHSKNARTAKARALIKEQSRCITRQWKTRFHSREERRDYPRQQGHRLRSATAFAHRANIAIMQGTRARQKGRRELSSNIPDLQVYNAHSGHGSCKPPPKAPKRLRSIDKLLNNAGIAVTGIHLDMGRI